MFKPVYGSGGEKMEYEEQRYGYRTQLDLAGITGTKSTHLPRLSARLILQRG
jgi:hypothetical protein